jgi:hypothetical protein
MRFLYSPSNQQEDFHRTLWGIPVASTRETPKVMILEELMTLGAVHQEYWPMAIHPR